MKISSDTLPSMATEGPFREIFKNFCCTVLAEARLYPKLSIPRIVEAHGAWQNDLHRVSGNERNLAKGLDHFKQSGHLAFWLRRTGPIIDVVDLTKNVADAEGYPLSSAENSFRDLLFAYCNEYISFDLGFQICLFYERAKVKGGNLQLNQILDEDYYRTICHFMKYKSVSPHAMFLIFKSLFSMRDVANS